MTHPTTGGAGHLVRDIRLVLALPRLVVIRPAVGTPGSKYISIYKFGLSVCLFVSNKRQNGRTDWAQFFCGTSRDPREGL